MKGHGKGKVIAKVIALAWLAHAKGIGKSKGRGVTAEKKPMKEDDTKERNKKKAVRRN